MAEKPKSRSARPVMAVIPCLDEADHIAKVIDRLAASAERLDMNIVVVDGGSGDGTPDIVAEMAASNPRLALLHNGKRVQSAAVNLAVECYGGEFRSFIRVDAHGDYPASYCDRLVEEAEATGADAVVVAMLTRGVGAFQKASGTSYMALGPGLRVSVCNRLDFGFGAAFSVEGSTGPAQVYRTELRIRF